MTSIVLGTIGQVAGGALGGAAGAGIGASIGRIVGASVDNALFGGGSANLQGPRLADLAVQTSTYGRMIPLVYGTVRIAGNIIWSLPIKETATVSSRGGSGGKGGGGNRQTVTNYSYSATLAIAICEGPIDKVLRVWADSMQLDLSQGTYRIYLGDEAQLPDSMIIAHEGIGKVPAYRGLAYVVIEDFPLGEFGNRIPNFTLEIKKKMQGVDSVENRVEREIRAINLIPGAGEFVYDTKVQTKLYGMPVGSGWAQQGGRMPVNRHNPQGIANAVLSLDQMEETLPNVEWVGIVVTWFGTSLDAGNCQIVPGVEYNQGATTTPDVWQVAGRHRGNAYLITQENGVPRYGGTPDDNSILRLVAELKRRGKKVMFYPMFFMDVPGKPWRGHVTGSIMNVTSFFTKTNGYNAFIMHYANLMQGKIDAFCIGSELVGLTKVSAGAGTYPAVQALANLAVNVKAVMGNETLLTYAADWSEYHHTDGGWYNLDPLWALPAIDIIGIDAYFPLTDAIQQRYDMEAMKTGWESGEGYDFYYADSARTVKMPLGVAYAWKNIRWWWENIHINPNSSATAWVPRSKKIWFTEYGFPSVDGATNQPNVFYDPSSSDSALPRFSRGRVDFRAQRMGIAATQEQWKNSDMVERMFLWAWDARPYPYWPDFTEIWADGEAWKTGHWVQGKLGMSGLGAIVRDIAVRAGLTITDIDVSRLNQLVEGCAITTLAPVRYLLEQWMAAYFFDCVESAGRLKFIPHGGETVKAISADSLAPFGDAREVLLIHRQQEIELPRQVNVLYIDRSAEYLQGNQFSTRQVTQSRQTYTIGLPIVFSDQGAKVLADQLLYALWTARVTYEFYLPVAFAALEPADVIVLAYQDMNHVMRITEILQASPGALRVRGVSEDAGIYDIYHPPGNGGFKHLPIQPVPEIEMHVLDLPAFPSDDLRQGKMLIAAAGLQGGWKGAAIYRSDDGGQEYDRIATVTGAASVGTALQALPPGKTEVMDEANSLEVLMLGDDELSGVSLQALLNGANRCAMGNEIFQFQQADFLGSGKYRLSGFLRGRLGTEHAVGTHSAGEKCIFLDGNIAMIDMSTAMIGLPRLYKGVSMGSTLVQAETQNFTYRGKALRPYSPVHVTASRDANGTVAISWIRRMRGGGEWRDYVDSPLNEISERYEIEILSGALVKRLLNSNSPQAYYTNIQQTEDFGSVQAEVTVRIYQLSDVIGRGYGMMAVV